MCRCDVTRKLLQKTGVSRKKNSAQKVTKHVINRFLPHDFTGNFQRSADGGSTTLQKAGTVPNYKIIRRHVLKTVLIAVRLQNLWPVTIF